MREVVRQVTEQQSDTEIVGVSRRERRQCPLRPVDVPPCLQRERWAHYLTNEQWIFLPFYSIFNLLGV